LYTTEEAFLELKSLGLATNITVFRRWMREGKIKPLKPQNETHYKLGYRIEEKELHRFIKERAPKVMSLIIENKELKKKIKKLENQQKNM
jgi:predicted site-specific integrase-resolvase